MMNNLHIRLRYILLLAFVVIGFRSFGATFTVTNNTPISVDAAGIEGSFVWAIVQAANDGALTLDDIVFDIQGPLTNGVHVINVIQPIQINTPVNILGYSQPGANIGLPKIYIEGSDANDGLQFSLVQPGTGLGSQNDGDPSGSSVTGIMIGNFSSFGLSMSGCNDMTYEDVWIGFATNGTTAINSGAGRKGTTITGVAGNNLNQPNGNVNENITYRNCVISTNLWMGMEVYNINNLVVENCKFGTDQDGFNTNDFGNGGSAIQTFSCDGVYIRDCTFGGNSRNAGVLNQNGGSSIGTISIGSSINVVIDNNNIGEAPDGSTDDMWNGAYGIYIFGTPAAPNNRFAGTYDVSITRNRINNTRAVGTWPGHGIHSHDVEGQEVHDITIQSNEITGNAGDGVNITGNVNDNIIGSPLGTDNETLGNNISSNGGHGVNIENGALRNTIRQNQIYCNGAVGNAPPGPGAPLEIELESGGNNEHLEPTFTSAPGAQPITGTCQAGDWIDIYAMSDCKNCVPSEKGDGENWLGGVACAGNSFTYNGTTSDKVSATATDPDGNTSEFTSCIENIDECDPPTVWVGDDFGMCGTDMNIANVSLTGSAPNGSQIGTWSVVSGPTAATFVSPNSPFTIAENLAGGTYVFRWTVVDSDDPSCSSFADITVEVDELPTPADGGEVTCWSEDEIELNGNVPTSGIGQWSVVSPNNLTIQDPNSANTIGGNLQSGENRFRWTIRSANGHCIPEQNDFVVIKDGIYSGGSDQTICATSWNGTLTGDVIPGNWNGDHHLWQYHGGGSTTPNISTYYSNQTSVTIPATGSGTYLFTYGTPDATCRDTVKITLGGGDPEGSIDLDHNTCDNFATLTGNIISGTSGEWSVTPNIPAGNGFDANSSVLNLTDLEPGTYDFTWTVNSDCGSSLDVSNQQLVILATPDSAIAGPSQEICISDLGVGVNMNATAVTAPSEGTWTTTSAGVNFGDDNSPTTTVTGLTIGEHLFTWTVGVPPSNTCGTSVDTMMIIIDAAPTDFPDLDTALCDVNLDIDLGTLNTGIGETGTWSITAGGGTLTPNDNPQTTVTGATIGMNTYVFTTSVPGSVCPADEATVNFEVLGQGGPANILEEDTLEICILSDTTLNAEDPSAYGTGIWSVVGTLTGAGDHINNLTGTSLGEGVTQVNWTVTYNTGCDPQTDSVWILVSPEPDVPEAGEDVDLCSTAGSYQLSGNNLGNEGYWETSGNGTFDDNTLFNATYTFGTSDTLSDQNVITLYWNSEGGGCPSLVDSMTITIDKTPIVEAGNDTLLCITQQPYTMTSLDNVYGTGVWTTTSTSANITDDGLYNTTVDGMAPGDHDFTWTVTNGECSGQDNVTISVEDTVTLANIPLDSLEICLAGGGEIRLPGNDPSSGTGLWTTVPVTTGGTIDDPSLYNSLVLNLADGNIMTAVWTISSATGVCPPSDDTIIVTVVDRVSPFVRLDAAPQDICLGDEVVFTATGINGGDAPVYTFFYADGTQIQQGPGNTLTLSPTQDTTVYVTMLSNSPCVDPSDVLATSDSVTIQVDTPPSPAVAGDDETVCTDSYTMQGVAPVEGSGVWSIASVTPAGSVVGVTPVTDANGVLATLVSGMEVTLYWTTSSDLGVCPADTDSVTITRVQDITIPDAGPDAVICAGSTHPLNANSVGAGETGEWTSSGTGTFGNVNDPNTVYTPSDADTTNGEVYLTWTISNGLCEPLSDSLRLQIDLNPTPADAGPDQIVCSDGTQLEGNEPLIGSGVWTTSSVNASIQNDTLYNTAVNNLDTFAITTFTWTISNGVCDPVSDAVNIDVRGAIKFPLIDGPLDICEVETDGSARIISLSIDPNTRPNTAADEQGEWTITSGSGTFGISGLTTSAEFEETYTVVRPADVTAGELIFTYTVTNTAVTTCTPTTNSWTVNIQELPSIALGVDTMQCEGPDMTVVGNEPTSGTGSWSISSFITPSGLSPTINSPNTATTTVTFPAPTDENATAVLAWTISTGPHCPASVAEVNLEIIGTDNPSFELDEKSPVCAGDEARIEVLNVANAGLTPTFVWSLNGVPYTPSNPDTVDIQVFEDGDVVQVEMTSSIQCATEPTAVESVTISVITPPEIALSSDDTLCFDETKLLELTTVSPTNGSFSNAWYVKEGGGIDSSQVATLVTNYVANETPRQAGTFDYYVIGSDASGVCPDVQSNTVTVKVLPDLFITSISASPENVYTDDPVTYVGDVSTSDNITYNWYVGEDALGTDASGIFVPQDYESLSGVDQADVWLVVSNELGCGDTARTRIYIFQPVRIPNVFTPNDDGVNDSWQISGINNYEGAELRVYNRWGNVVYKYTHENRDDDFQFWDGKNNRGSNFLPVGTYYFELDKKIKIREDEPIKISGDVTLLR